MTLHRQQADKPTQKTLARDVFDVAVVGAGVVGSAIARRFSIEGARVAVVEKASDILDGASKANSAILHTGFDAPPDSLELSCIRDGYREYVEIHRKMGLPLEKTGAYAVAWNGGEVARLEKLVVHAHNNGITGVELTTAQELFRNEPNLAKNAVAAVSIPGEAIIDPWSAPYAYLNQSLANGSQIFLSCEVTDGILSGSEWRLSTSRGTLKCRHVINCAGLYGDSLDQALLGTAKFRIKPRKGQFVVFDKAASSLINSIILPVPTNQTKGVLVCRTVFGNVLVGPTAEDQESRTDAATDEITTAALIASAADKIPALKSMPVTAIYAGLRPATEYKDYQIEAEPDRNWITVGGIRSTGLTGALGIARHVFELYSNLGPKHRPVHDPELPRVPVLAECGRRNWQRKGHGGIVCHCELVTEREIQEAMTGPLAARSLAGLKRQTRATMGRCQGFYCLARLAELTDGRFGSSLSVEVCHV